MPIRSGPGRRGDPSRLIGADDDAPHEDMLGANDDRANRWAVDGPSDSSSLRIRTRLR